MRTPQKGDSARLSSRQPSAQLGLLERDAELAAVTTLIDLTSDRGRVLVIEAPPGLGKTSLIAETKFRARGGGMHVLSARGADLEQTFSYGVVRQLFEPFLHRLSAKERAELLGGAAALAMPLFDPAQLAAEPAADASLAALHGLYWLAANVAAQRPLLLAIDDLHWCDPASLRWLAYLAARIEDLPLALAMALRSGEPGMDPLALGQILSDPLTTVVRPAPLTREATGQFIRRLLAPEAEDSFCAACHQESGGNPLLLRELLNAVASEGLTPTAANVERMRELEADAVSQTVSLRLIRLPPDARRLARAVAILGEDADPRHAAAMAELDEASASQAAAELVRIDILSPHAPLAFVHPVVGAAVYSTLTAVEQDESHARAARLLADSGAEPERVAAHLLRVAPSADLQVVKTLREAARGALARGAADSAVVYLRRALAEPPSGSERVEVLFELGSAETLVSGPAAVEHLREAHELIEDPVRRAEAALLLARQLYLLHHADESVAVSRRALEELGSANAELGRRLDAGLILNAITEPRLYDLAVDRLERIRSLRSDTTPGEKMLLGLLAYHDARANAPADVAVGLARRALAGGILLKAAKGGGPFIFSTIVLAMADLDEALEIYDEALEVAHRRGSVFAFAVAKIFRSQLFLYRGELLEAEAEGREALEACDAWGLHLAAGYLHGYLADALIEQGKVDDAAAVLARGAYEDDYDTAHAHWFLDSRARLRMVSGDFRQGLEDTFAARRSFEAVGGRNPAFMAWRSQAALFLLRLGEEDEARRLVGEELELARSWGAPRALGAALRVTGLVEGGDGGIALLREAVEVLKGSPAKLEHAKARTELGAALRRSNRRVEAREQLRRAVELATMCGAAPLAARAETELLATGARPRRIALSGVDSLTPSERRVAQMAAEGQTNREVAQALFVSPKTVEVHLSSVYRKLGIRSRSQLPVALTEPAGAHP
ncbi:MAG TPA: LuxR C-terminal-related transcriptional regulator [Gaiellaceae bacterium]|nr:LuxR C-terminal-related transcriptional regulator [Gaiellaceae bacterium]